MLIIENGEVYTPAPRGKATIVVAGGRIEKIGDVSAASLRALDPEVIDATGCIVVPGLIDCHIHLIGGSGEKGFASATPGITAQELLAAGTTTVVGLLGTDTTTKTLPVAARESEGAARRGTERAHVDRRLRRALADRQRARRHRADRRDHRRGRDRHRRPPRRPLRRARAGAARQRLLRRRDAHRQSRRAAPAHRRAAPSACPSSASCSTSAFPPPRCTRRT